MAGVGTIEVRRVLLIGTRRSAQVYPLLSDNPVGNFRQSYARSPVHTPLFTRRYASTSSDLQGEGRSLVTRMKNLLYGVAITSTIFLGYLYVTDTRAQGLHRWVVVPAIRWVYPDAEDAHEAGNTALRALHQFGLHPRERGDPDKVGDLAIEVFGHTLDNPIGTSAGIDKHAEIPTPLLALGPAIIEVGGATPLPQDGNPKPRVFRLPSQKALINRYGLNSEGADNVAMRLRQRVREFARSIGLGIDEEAERKVLNGEAGVPPGSLVKGKLMAVQVAKNKFTSDNDIEAIKRDYVYCVDALAKYADIIVVNVSSPNTPGLRNLQRVEPLTNILTGVVQAASNTKRNSRPAVMVKVSPDEDSEEQVAGICEAVWASGVDGIIVGNTTKRRPDPHPEGTSLSDQEARVLLEQGGYSGPQLFSRTVALVKRYRRILDEGLHTHQNEPVSSPPPKLQDLKSAQIAATVERDVQNLKSEADNKSQPLIRLPERHTDSSPHSEGASGSGDANALSLSHHNEQASNIDVNTTVSSTRKDSSTQKVIFATGGITNGEQALEVLNAGASVAMVYTALVYGGAGTISRIKDEMRAEMKKRLR